jgi:Ser/Thr protein kinase RdoA (MazF antagonist)
MRRVAVRALGVCPLAGRELLVAVSGSCCGCTARPVMAAMSGAAVVVGSELGWVIALRAGTDLLVLVPSGAAGGTLMMVAACPGVPGPRVCSVLRWVEGRVDAGAPGPVHRYRFGGVRAWLRDQGGRWRVPSGFARIRWDGEAFAGDMMLYGGRRRGCLGPAPRDLRRGCARVACWIRRVMSRLGQDGGQAGLIHAGLHLGSVLFRSDEVRVIDFR